MARTREIPRAGWEKFFHMITRQLQNHPVRVEVEKREIGDQSMARGLPDDGRVVTLDVNEETNAIARRYAEEAGFGGFDVLPIENDFYRFYRLAP